MEVKISNLKVFHPGAKHPLFGVKKFRIPKGGKVLLRGPSGRGKTTFLHAIAGLFPPREGEISIGGISLNSMTADQRALFRADHVGLVFQKLNLFDYLTSLENILLAPKSDETKALEALKYFGLAEKTDLRSSLLSLGEQQRLAVARVVAAQHDLILADEPTASLDEPNAKLVIEALVKSTRDQTVLVVSHDPRWESLFDEVIEFEKLVHS